MATNGTATDNAEDVSALFSQIGDLEKEFADVELDALRRKEFDLKDLYTRRTTLLSQVPSFWSTVFLNGPEEVQSLYSSSDLAVLSAIKEFTVERYQIKSHTEGEPRSLRFTFEFEKNDFFEDSKLVKEFEYKPDASGGPGNLVSKAVPIKWKKGKARDLTDGLLGAAVELEQAEGALGKDVEQEERENLWQYEKLREKIEKAEEDDSEQPSFLNWFGFRGAVAAKPEKAKEANSEVNGDEEEEDDDESEDEDDGMLDVEIFPAGEEVAIALAEDLWPGVMDYFIQAQEDPAEFDGFESDDTEVIEGEEAPELVLKEEVEVKDDRPRKKQRRD